MHSAIDSLLNSALHKLGEDGRPIPHNRWQKLLSRTAGQLLPAFHHSPWMEWEYGTWVGAFAGYDEVGRQLGEANVLPEWRATPLDDRWRPFKGPGIRNGCPYNVDAMHEMVQCWDELLVDAATLREIYCRRTGRSGHLSALDLYIITTVAVSISSFLLRRGDNPTQDGKLPRTAAAAFKVLGGMFAATNRMITQAHPLLLEPELDVDAFLQYLEDERLLLSPEMRACAGPVKMIQQILSAAIDPPETSLTGKGLAYLGADIERAFDYGVQCVRIDTGVLLYWRALGLRLQLLLKRTDTPDSVREMLLAEAELGMEDNIPFTSYAAIAQALLDRLGDSAPEQDFLHTLSSAKDDPQHLETVMRVLFHEQKHKLDSILQRTSPAIATDAWTPAPCSGLLRDLLKHVRVDALSPASV